MTHAPGATRIATPVVAAVWRAWTEDAGAWSCPRPWTAKAKANHAAMGFEAGWNAATDQREAIAVRLAGQPIPPRHGEVAAEG